MFIIRKRGYTWSGHDHRKFSLFAASASLILGYSGIPYLRNHFLEMSPNQFLTQ